ncbi:MAG: NTP transferase domain-containing protein [Phycisphaerales bacterium]|nr:NTP transferase domain-containing protein [Phycisphaerales bacterium]
MPAPERTPPSLAHVLVLAAGRGVRMGGPKALMDVGGRPWWRHQRDCLPRPGFTTTWVVSPGVRDGMSVKSDRPELVVVDPDRPMFASILAGLASLRASPPGSVFILPVDCPAPSMHVWEALASPANRDSVTIPTHMGATGHPVHLPWRFVTDVLDPAVSAAADADTLRLDTFIGSRARRVPVDDPRIAMNLNTPGDVKEWLLFRNPQAADARS